LGRQVRVILTALRRGQQAEQVTQFGHRIPPGGLDGSQRRRGIVGIRDQHLAGGASLDHHQADAVADNVVQLPGDPGPLGLDSGPGGILTFPFEQPAALLEGLAV
jgi:hypothetical protein